MLAGGMAAAAGLAGVAAIPVLVWMLAVTAIGVSVITAASGPGGGAQPAGPVPLPLPAPRPLTRLPQRGLGGAVCPPRPLACPQHQARTVGQAA